MGILLILGSLLGGVAVGLLFSTVYTVKKYRKGNTKNWLFRFLFSFLISGVIAFVICAILLGYIIAKNGP